MNAIKNQEAILKSTVASYKKACTALESFAGTPDSDEYCNLLDNKISAEKAVIQAGVAFAALAPQFKTAKSQIDAMLVKAERNIIIRHNLAAVFVNSVNKTK